MLRYWNGTLWTDHRQPLPEAVPQAPVEPAMPIVEADPDPMAEYERQFEPQAQFQPRFQPHFAPSQESQWAPAAVATATTLTSPLAAAAPAPHVVPVLAADDGVIGFGRNRKGVFAALKGMGIGLLVVVIGLGVMGFLSVNNSVGAGEAKSTGIVTSLGTTAGNTCAPIARFAVKGQSYTANSTIEVSPCSVGLGQTVDVIYSTADPASDARIDLGFTISQFAWLIPVLGGIVFLGSLGAFIVRAGSIAGGIALIRDGNKHSKKPVS